MHILTSQLLAASSTLAARLDLALLSLVVYGVVHSVALVAFWSRLDGQSKDADDTVHCLVLPPHGAAACQHNNGHGHGSSLMTAHTRHTGFTNLTH